MESGSQAVVSGNDLPYIVVRRLMGGLVGRVRWLMDLSLDLFGDMFRQGFCFYNPNHAAAFRALADMAAFDPHIDASRLDSRLTSCAADSSASPAARVMAAQLCGERGITSARAALARIAADRAQSEPLRLAAANSARMLAD